MKKKLMLWLALLLLASSAGAEGVTIRTVSCFAGKDASAEAYTRLLARWEEKTGNVVSDASSTSDESWKTGVLMDFAAGNEPDVLFFFARTADSAILLDRVVPVADVNAAFPDLMIPEDPACRETDGKIYAVPVRSYWEGLLCNTDLFEQYGVELPHTFAQLESAVRVFRENGVVPISASLSDVPHYLAEFAVLASGSLADYQARPRRGESVPRSWVDGMTLIARLYALGAFPDNVNATSEQETSQLFRDKKAAMQLDGSWFANSLPEANMDTTVVLPFPARAAGEEVAVIGGVSMGFYLTRRAFRDERVRGAAASLLAWLSTGDNARALGGFRYSGRMMESARELTRHTLCGPIQDQMSQEARSEWFRLIPEVAAGRMTPEALWDDVMALDPFAP